MTQPRHPHLPRMFPGGLHPDEHKSVSNDHPIQVAPLLGRYVVPLRQHIGTVARPLVRAGDRVLKGQLIGAPVGRVSAAVHAPTSGRVLSVADHPVAHPSGLRDLCVEIEADGRDEAVEFTPIAWRDLAPAKLHRQLADLGLTGQGGAVFPSHIKLEPTAMPIRTLILNGAECEPWITCDDRLMRERAEDILRGAEVIRHALGADEILLGIEDNKPEAAAAMVAARANTGIAVQVVVVPTRYPSGGGKQITQLLTGLETPSGKITTDVGVQVFNVGTAYALHRAVSLGEPMLTRIVTVTGHVARPGNIEARLGTPLADLLDLAGGELPGGTGHIIGGPLMGYELDDTAAPVTKGLNCIIAKSERLFPAHPAAMPCIRCGACAAACPVSLQPFEMYWYARVKDFDKASRYHLMDCIECGCCSHVCPSHIPLVDYYRFAKNQLQQRERDKQAAEVARQRHEFHTLRLEREKQEKAARLAKKTAAPAAQGDPSAEAAESASKQAILAAAIERAKQTKAAAQPLNTDHLSPEQQRQVDEIEARRGHSNAGGPTTSRNPDTISETP